MSNKLKVKAGNLHYPNDTQEPQATPEADVTNNQSSMMLESPEDHEGSGPLHFPNDTNEGTGVEVPTKEAVSAAAKMATTMARLTKTKANTAEPGAVGPAKAEDEGGNGNNLATLGNGVEAPAPTDGYLEVREGDTQPPVGTTASTDEDEEDDEEDEVDAAAVSAAFDFEETDLSDGSTPQQQIEIGADVDEDWDPEPEGEEDEALEIVDDEDTGMDEGVVDTLEVDDSGIDLGDDEFEEPAAVATANDSDVMDLIDVDGTEDNGDDMAFATCANVVHVIKGNRIIASMGKKHATKAGVADVYLADQFTDVVAAEVERQGLRKGLKEMGFVMARVNVTSNKVVNKRVEAKAAKVSASVRAAQAQYDQVFEQSLAIAATGMGKQYFKDVKNPLRAALVERLEQAGVRGANRMVASVFAKEGVQYTKEMVALAKRLSAMHQETRNSLSAALDMTSDEVVDDEDTSENLIENENEDFDQFDDEFIDDIEAPSSIEAALTRPIHRKSVNASFEQGTRVDAGALLTPKNRVKLSAAAQAVIAGDLLFKPVE